MIKDEIRRERNKKARKKYHENIERERLRLRAKYHKNKDRYLQYQKQEIPKKRHKCHQYLFDKISKGVISKRNSCEICHTSPTECHHDNYTKPLEFIELCVKCHRTLHRHYVENNISLTY